MLNGLTVKLPPWEDDKAATSSVCPSSERSMYVWVFAPQFPSSFETRPLIRFSCCIDTCNHWPILATLGCGWLCSRLVRGNHRIIFGNLRGLSLIPMPLLLNFVILAVQGEKHLMKSWKKIVFIELSSIVFCVTRILLCSHRTCVHPLFSWQEKR